jgi:hypothetical protein
MLNRYIQEGGSENILLGVKILRKTPDINLFKYLQKVVKAGHG